MPRATWLTFRRTYSSWAHEKGVPGKVVAELMGRAKVDTTVNVYTQVIDGSKRVAAQVGNGLFAIVRQAGRNGGANPLNCFGEMARCTGRFRNWLIHQAA